MKKLSTLCFLWVLFSSYGPGNCTLYKGDCNKACLKAEEAIQYPQGSRESQIRFDEAIQMCPTFDYPYYEKAVPYAKRGDIENWKKLIDKAIEIDPKEHLANRGWYHFFFLNNYKAAIRDIEKLDSLNPYDIGLTGDATYHLNIMKSICYYEIGEQEKALFLFEKQMSDSTHFISLFDYVCLGVMYQNAGKYEKAIAAFEQQAEQNDIAENHFYLAQIYHSLGNLDLATKELELAEVYYNNNRTMENPYRELPFEIYQVDIKKLKDSLEQKEVENSSNNLVGE